MVEDVGLEVQENLVKQLNSLQRKSNQSKVHRTYPLLFLSDVVNPPESLGDLGDIYQVLHQLEVLEVVHVWLDSVLWKKQVFVLNLKLDLREVQVLSPLIWIELVFRLASVHRMKTTIWAQVVLDPYTLYFREVV